MELLAREVERADPPSQVQGAGHQLLTVVGEQEEVCARRPGPVVNASDDLVRTPVQLLHDVGAVQVPVLREVESVEFDELELHARWKQPLQ